jgi:iron(III) transport system permease protein
MAVAVILVALPVGFLIVAAFDVGDKATGGTFALGLSNFAVIPRYLDWLGNSFIVAVPATLLAVIAGLILAWIINRTTIPGAAIFEQLIYIPYFMPPIVGALAWSLLGAERTGIINQVYRAATGSEAALVNTHSPLGIIFVMAIYEGTLAFIMISAAMKSMDPSLEDSSLILGAGRFKTAMNITLPLLAPAVLGSTIFIFAEAVGSFSVPAILGMNVRFFVVSTGIFNMIRNWPPNYPAAAVLGLSLFLFTAGAVWLYGRAIRGRSFTTITGKAFRPRRINMGRWTPVLFGICVLYILIAVVIPLGVLTYASFLQRVTTNPDSIVWTFNNYRDVLFGYAPAIIALRNSLVLGVLTATVGVIFMGLLAWTMYRGSSRRRGLLEYVVMFPQAVPRMVLALGLLWAWLIIPIGIYGTIWLLLLAYLTAFLPMGVRAIAGIIQQVDRSLEESAKICGASWLRILMTVTLPLLRPGIVSTWVLLFIVSLREISVSILLVTGQNMVVGPSIFVFYEMGGIVVVSALAMLLTALILIPLTTLRILVGRTPVSE